MKLKELAAMKALEYVRSGMILGLGTGSTSAIFVDALGSALRQGTLKDIRGVPTSIEVADRARQERIPLTTLADNPRLDLAVDGADEVDGQNNLIKGLGRALLREKIVEIHAERFIVIVDESKLVTSLGSKVPLPVEIIQFEAEAHVRWLTTLGCRAGLWLEKDGQPVVTDNGNYLARCWFNQSGGSGIPDIHKLDRELNQRPGIVEHGLFLGMADQVIVAGKDGIKMIE